MTYLNWRKSTYSLSNGNCVEVGTGQETVAVRDSKDPAGPVIDVSPQAWIKFTAYLKSCLGPALPLPDRGVSGRGPHQ
jgi:hypothetical protein